MTVLTNRRRAVVLVLLAGLLGAACSGGGSTGAEGEPPAEAVGAEFTAATLGGGELASSSFSGRDTVLWFWAPWCTVCRSIAGDVVAASGQLAGSVELIGIAGRGDVPDMDDFVSDTGTGSLTHVVDADGAIWRSYEVTNQPAFAFIDDDGTVDVAVGPLREAELVARMEALART